jgi:hypothetical protein
MKGVLVELEFDKWHTIMIEIFILVMSEECLLKFEMKVFAYEI